MVDFPFPCLSILVCAWPWVQVLLDTDEPEVDPQDMDKKYIRLKQALECDLTPSNYSEVLIHWEMALTKERVQEVMFDSWQFA